MIKILRATKPQSPEAVKQTQNVAAYLNATYPEVKAEVYVERFGDVDTIYLLVDYPDLATREAIMAKVAADQKFQALMAEGRQRSLFVPSSAHVTVLQKAS
jgi:hypothetical protein